MHATFSRIRPGSVAAAFFLLVSSCFTISPDSFLAARALQVSEVLCLGLNLSVSVEQAFL